MKRTLKQRTRRTVIEQYLIAAMVVLMMFVSVSAQAWPWPDTGRTKCYNDSVEIACSAPGQPFYGQDAQYQGPTRSYTKLGQNGVALADTATQESGWIMTRDNVTGLVWEMKTYRGDGGIHDTYNTYTWCDTNPATNGGNQGTCCTGPGDAATGTKGLPANARVMVSSAPSAFFRVVGM